MTSKVKVCVEKESLLSGRLATLFLMELSENNTTTYYPGDVITEYTDPLFIFLDLNHANKRCSFCMMKSKDLQMCKSCQVVSYCSNDCMNENYKKVHEFECNSPTYHYCLTHHEKASLLYLFRFYATIKSNPTWTEKPFTMYNGSVRSFNCLLSNMESWTECPFTRNMCSILANKLQLEDSGVTVEYLIFLKGILFTNSIGHFDEEGIVGHSIYMQRTIFDHSCRPSATDSIINGRYVVRALTLIPEGVAPKISYLNENETLIFSSRQQLLMEDYKFQCQCDVCVHDMKYQFDYLRLHQLHFTLKFLMARLPPLPVAWDEIYSMHEEYISMLRQLYHEYDQHISKHFLLFSIFAERIMEDNPLVEYLCGDADDHLRITYGKDGEVYLEFTRNIIPSLE